MAAVTTEVGVANLALQRVGAKTITAFDDSVRNSDAVNLHFEDVRDEVQRLFPWACLTGRTALSTSAASNSSFAYTHTLAATVWRVLDINGDEANRFRVEGTTLYTDEETGYFRAVSQSSTVTAWDPLLISAIEARLAHKIAFKLTQDLQLTTSFFQEFLLVLGLAIRLKAIEEHEDNEKILQMMMDMAPTQLMTKKDFVSE